MKVAKDLVVSLAYQVRTEDGVLVDESPVSCGHPTASVLQAWLIVVGRLTNATSTTSLSR